MMYGSSYSIANLFGDELIAYFALVQYGQGVNTVSRLAYFAFVQYGQGANTVSLLAYL